MKTYDIELHCVQSEELDAMELSRLLPVLLQQHQVHVNSIKVTERSH